MKVLEANRKLFVLLGAFSPSDEHFDWSSRIGSCTLGIICFVFPVISTISSIAFILNNVKTNLEDALYALLQVAGFGYAAYTMIFAFFLRNDLKVLLDHFQDICDTCKLNQINNIQLWNMVLIPFQIKMVILSISSKKQMRNVNISPRFSWITLWLEIHWVSSQLFVLVFFIRSSLMVTLKLNIYLERWNTCEF